MSVYRASLKGPMEQLVLDTAALLGIDPPEAIRHLLAQLMVRPTAIATMPLPSVALQGQPEPTEETPSPLDGSQGSSSTPPTPNPPYSSLPELSPLAETTEPEAAEPAKPRLPPGFEEFWLSWPKRRRKNRGTAVKAWEKAQKANLLPALPEILQAVAALKKTQDWTKDNGQFIPLPASWLNGQGWEDADAKPEPVRTENVRAALTRSLDQLRTDAMEDVRQAVAGRLTGAEVRLFNDEISEAQPADFPAIVERARTAAESRERGIVDTTSEQSFSETEAQLAAVTARNGGAPWPPVVDLMEALKAKLAEGGHLFVGRLDQYCEQCGRPDRDPVHVWPEAELDAAQKGVETNMRNEAMAIMPKGAAQAMLDAFDTEAMPDVIDDPYGPDDQDAAEIYEYYGGVLSAPGICDATCVHEVPLTDHCEQCDGIIDKCPVHTGEPEPCRICRGYMAAGL